MAKFYVGRGRGPRGFDEYIVPIKWLRRFAHKGRMRAATEEEVQRYALADTFRPVRLEDLPPLLVAGPGASSASVAEAPEQARIILGSELEPEPAKSKSKKSGAR